MTAPVVVYSKPHCQQCTATKRRLRAKGVEFEQASLLDEGNLAAAKALGHKEAPVVVVGDVSWSGFRPDLIDDLVKERLGDG